MSLAAGCTDSSSLARPPGKTLRQDDRIDLVLPREEYGSCRRGAPGYASSTSTATSMSFAVMSSRGARCTLNTTCARSVPSTARAVAMTVARRSALRLRQ